MKTAIFGGAFNPIHSGHIHLLSEMNKIYSFDKIILIPTGNPPHKSSEEFVSADDRIAMCRLFAERSSNIEVSEIETNRKGKSYTFDTLNEIRSIFPEDELYLIIGGDMLLIFDKWYNFGEISKLANIICAARNDNEYEKLKEKSKELQKLNCIVTVHKIKPFEVSSTEIRKNIYEEKSIDGLVPNYISDYIYRKNLYKAGDSN